MKLPSVRSFLKTLVLLFSSSAAFAQLTGSKTIPGDYATIANAVVALNTSGVGAGGVTFNVAAGYTETITATIALTATGTAANPIVFQKDPGTVGTNPLITAYTTGTGTPATAVQDGLWRMSGSDYVTINGIDLSDNAANTTNPSTMEYGYALYKAGTSNGCQNVTIRNCTITLNIINNATGSAPMVDGSAGIIMMNATGTAAVTALTPVAGGQNSNNKFYSNTIQNCNTGIALIGYAAATPFTLADVNNDVGGSSFSTGNTFLNFGGAPAATNPAVAIRTLAQYTLNVSYNTVNNNNGGGTNHVSTLRGIYINTATSASATITYNTITLKGGGTTQNLSGIENAAGSTAASNTINISNNTITNCTYSTATTGGFYGIYNLATPATLTISNNAVSNNSSAATTTGFLYCIYNAGAASAVNMNSNTVSGNTTGTLTTGKFVGVYNAASALNVNMNSNTLYGNATSALSGVYYAIYNTGTVVTTLNINNNNIGTGGSPAITFNAANSGAQLLINTTKGAATAALSISGNSFQNVSFAVAGTASVTFISNTAATLSQDINSNTFTNVNMNTSGSVTFIANSVSLSSTGTQNVNSNAVGGTFTKAAGGTITLFTSTAASSSGSVINNTGNDFSNITTSGATIMAGWVNTDAGSSTKTISSNIFSNWTFGAGAVTVLNVNLSGTGNATTGNLISDITSAAAITAITTGAGNDKIFGNTIHSLTTTGASAITAIAVTSGTTKYVYGNKIYNLQASIAGGTVNGILVSGATTAVVTAHIYNNLIGDLRTPAASAADPVRGISITSTRSSSTVNVYNNTIYLNATSSGTNFGSTGIYHTANATATTAVLNLRNNIVANLSTANGSGITVAYRRSSTALDNYASTSNNNLFYAGTPGAKYLIFYDGTNSDQTLAAFKTRVGARDAQSFTEDISGVFLSTSGASASFLHLNTAIATQAESGGGSISGFSTDYDTQTRQGNIGYTGGGTAPDIGADEFEGIKALPLSGVYTLGSGGNYSSLTQNGGLFAAINSLGLAGDVEIDIISNLTEDGSNILNRWAEQGVGNYTLTIETSTATNKLIAGNVAGPLIRFEGASRVTIDGGDGGGGRYLTFRNTNTAGTVATAFTFINGATGNTITYCNLEAFSNATNGIVLFSTSSVSGGNSSNTISNCNLNATVSGNTGNVCIYSAGTSTSGYQNADNVVTGCNIYDFRDRAIDITATGSTGWTVSGNSIYNGNVSGGISYAAASALHGIRILGGAGYSVLNNYVGGSAALTAGSAAPYISTAGLLTYEGIFLTTTSASPASYIQGNLIANISVEAVPNSTSSAGSNVFFGIETAGTGIYIGGAQPGEGNIVGSNTSNGSIAVTTNTALATHKSNVRGINCGSTGGLILGNQVGGIDIKNIGAGPGPSTFFGIYVNSASAPSQVNNNIVGSSGSGAAANSIRVLSTSASTTTALTGIGLSSVVTSTVQVDGNIIKNLGHLSTVSTLTTGGITGISSAAAGTAVVSVTNNTISGNYIALYTTGTFYGISNTGAANTFSVSSNTIAGNSSATASGVYHAIYNSGAVTAAIAINSNNIGTSGADAFTFTAANSGANILIRNTAGGAAAALSISSNNFYNIVYAAASTGANTYILNAAPTLSQVINGNTFLNGNLNSSGSVTFISNNVVVSASGTQNVNNNSLSGGFTKAAGGTVTLFTSIASSVAGAVINHIGNNFSNITVTGATIIAGWTSTDAGGGTKTISNNIFSTWSGGTGAITALSVNSTSTSNSTMGNLINAISGGGAVTGITTAAGNDNISANTINTLSTTGAAAVIGIAVTAGTAKDISRNKIYDLLSGSATGTVNGITVSGTTIVAASLYNNLIGDLRAPAANSTTDLVRAIAVTATATNSTINVYFNTIYLNATSSGTNFSTTGVFHSASATATTATLSLRNNSITNTSVPKGTGVTAAYRRSGTPLGNYAAASNNNLFYSGTPASNKPIFYDGTNSDQTLAAFKTRVSTRESLSVTEDLSSKFLSTSGLSSVFLHMNATTPSLVESGAVNISGITTDFDGQIRQGNTGYSGSGYAPDIGADEVFGIEVVPPVISYTAFGDTTSTVNRVLAGISITDGSGINNLSGTKPRLYYKRLGDANTWVDNTSSTNGWKFTETTSSGTPYSFTVNYALLFGGAAVTAGVIQYFIVAQDLATTANVGLNSGVLNASAASVALTAANFPVTGTINSYEIPFSGSFNVGTAEVFTSLTKANGLFAAINEVGLMGNTTVNITSDLAEDGLNELIQWPEFGSGNYKLVIQPDGASPRMISGSVSNGLIRFNGADRVKIDGSSSGGGTYLSFRNTNTSGTTGTAFTFLNGASNDTLAYCNLEAYADASDGVLLFGSSTVAGGNSNNLVGYCNINATVSGNTGSLGIFSSGTTGKENITNTVTGNSIFAFRDRAIDIAATGSSGWTISGNSCYNGNVSGSINYGASSSLHGIRILGGSGYGILNNYIGGNAALASGGTNAVYASTLGNVSYTGIALTTSSSTPASDIKGNTIARITVTAIPTSASSSVFTGIDASGSGISIGGSTIADGNRIGSNTVNGSITVTTTTAAATSTSLVSGIKSSASGGVINRNQVGGVDINNIGAGPAPSQFQGIWITNASPPTQVNGNTVGSTGTGAVSNSIRVRSTSAALTTSLSGITIASSVAAAVQVDSNTIQNLTNNSTASSGSFTGILNSGSAVSTLTITNNTIKNISGAANANINSTLYTGISASAPSTISNNVLDNISLAATGTAAQVRGISVSGGFSYTISGNTLSNFTSASGKTADIETQSASAYTICGILNTASASGQVISSNALSGFSATASSAINTAVTGIGVSASGGNVYNNRIASFTNSATGTATLPGISGIMAAGGAFNCYNNSIRISNSFNTNGLKIYGINHAGGTGWNFYYNTVSVSGNATGTAARSAAYIRSAATDVLLLNNVLVNTRTGTGAHYAISNIVSPATQNWTTSSSDYNDLYSAGTSTTAEWGAGANKTFAQWQLSSGGDVHSLSRSVTFLSSTYDLQPDAVTNCALDNTGVPVTTPVSITADINGITRSAVSPDLGAYEFSYIPFVLTAGSNTPVCAGGTVDLSVDPGNAVTPSFSWRNPSGTVVATSQNPTVAAQAGQFKITVTDINGCLVTDSTLVSTNTRPTGSLTAPSTVCAGSSIALDIHVTGAGTLSGTLTTGDAFSGTAPLISLTLTPESSTSYVIDELSDANCSALPQDIPDTVTVAVIPGGQWTGAVSSNWNTAGNWFCSLIPDAASNVIIPGGLPHYPSITSGTSAINDLTINNGGSLTVNGGTLQIGGNISSAGSFFAANGSIELNGEGVQTIPANLFSGNEVKNLTIDNAAGVNLSGTLGISGILKVTHGSFSTGSYLTLLSTVSQTALIDGSGSGSVLGSVTMQRYLPSGFGYRYLSSPFLYATVNELSDDLDLASAFPALYTYDENKVSSGWTSYLNSSDTLFPLKGYAANFGSSALAKTIDIQGVVNNGTVSSGSLLNHNRTYTLGYNLIGNPFPSPIDWNASSGWTKTNIDNAIYFFNTGSTDQYTGSYSSYVNGVSSDGVAGNIIPSMQGFFVHVTNGTYPVTGGITVNSNARTTQLSPAFHKTTMPSGLIRVSAGFSEQDSLSDHLAVYFDEAATDAFDRNTDALKLMNTDNGVPNLYVIGADGTRLSISSTDTAVAADKIIPLGIKTEQGGDMHFYARELSLPEAMHVYLYDAGLSATRDLGKDPQYSVFLPAGVYEDRFFLLFTRKDKPDFGNERSLNAYTEGGRIFVSLSFYTGEQGPLSVYNALGQVVWQNTLSGYGRHEIAHPFAPGMYILSFNGLHSACVKIVVGGR